MITLVAGSTGSLGGRIVHDLLAQGDAVRALVRPASDGSALEKAGAEVAKGDVKDPASLARACAGVEVVISTVSMSGRGDDAPDNVDGRGNQNLIDAAAQAGVRHFVLVSTSLASPDSPVPLFRAKAAAEAHLKQSGLTYTILHANAFMDVWFGMLVEAPLSRGEPVSLVGASTRRHSFIAARDVAAFALAVPHEPSARNATIPIGGPDAVTFRDVVLAYEQASGRKIPVLSVAPGAPIPGVPEGVWGIAAALETFDSPMPMEDTARRFGVNLTSAGEFARGSGVVRA
jgi:uncharacterized protein YbjT (DUF2867 family)